jgi:hypothetical protein
VGNVSRTVDEIVERPLDSTGSLGRAVETAQAELVSTVQATTPVVEGIEQLAGSAAADQGIGAAGLLLADHWSAGRVSRGTRSESGVGITLGTDLPAGDSFVPASGLPTNVQSPSLPGASSLLEALRLLDSISTIALVSTPEPAPAVDASQPGTPPELPLPGGVSTAYASAAGLGLGGLMAVLMLTLLTAPRLGQRLRVPAVMSRPLGIVSPIELPG